MNTFERFVKVNAHVTSSADGTQSCPGEVSVEMGVLASAPAASMTTIAFSASL